MQSPNGPSTEGDTFERDLKEMLKDAPNLNDLSSTVQAGSIKTDGGKPQAYIRPDSTQSTRMAAAQSNMPRSQTVPPGEFYRQQRHLPVNAKTTASSSALHSSSSTSTRPAIPRSHTFPAGNHCTTKLIRPPARPCISLTNCDPLLQMLWLLSAITLPVSSVVLNIGLLQI